MLYFVKPLLRTILVNSTKQLRRMVSLGRATVVFTMQFLCYGKESKHSFCVSLFINLSYKETNSSPQNFNVKILL